MSDPMPHWIEPMRARAANDLPTDEAQWAYEMKWEGARVLIWLVPGDLAILNADRRDVTWRYPELSSLIGELGSRRAILDGEIVGFDHRGQPSFDALQQRLGIQGGRRVPTAPGIPIAFMAFDLLYLDDRSWLDKPFEDRREGLEALRLEGDYWHTPPAMMGWGGDAVLRLSRERDLGGVIAKRLESRYEPGGRSAAWIRVQNQQERELVVGGWVPGEGQRAGGIGSLVVGYWDDSDGGSPPNPRGGRLICVGSVGSGFNERTLNEIKGTLAGLARERSPFDGGEIPLGTRFVEPRLVCKVEFTDWTSGRGTLRHPVFKGFREERV